MKLFNFSLRYTLSDTHTNTHTHSIHKVIRSYKKESEANCLTIIFERQHNLLLVLTYLLEADSPH